jgi:hypothetical protein
MEIPQRLFTLYELNPKAYKDNLLNIPESGNGLPDLLDEARWDLDFRRRLKGLTGGVCGGIETTSYPHPSWVNKTKFYSYKEEPFSTMMYAGMCAHFAHCLELAEDPLNERDFWIREAQAAFQWAGGSKYPTPSRWRDRLRGHYAAACVYRVTGDQEALDLMLKGKEDMDANHGAGGLIYCLTDPERWPNYDKAKRASIKELLIAGAMKDLEYAKDRAMRYMLDRTTNFGWGMGFTPDTYGAIGAHHLLDQDQDPRADELLAHLYTTADFFLGTYGDNRVFITGSKRIGADRTCTMMLATDQAYDGIPGLIPGIVLYAYAPRGFDAIRPPGFRRDPQTEAESIEEWPKYETNNDRSSPATAGEFTVYQTILPHSYLHSYLAAQNGPRTGVPSISRAGR